ncbi:hypothetical protein RirG_156530 [Rhizophagus irregularis DAOM 197198w]|uniref:Uncharacterized protein n=1 Tax=Rhizophagus irregularis (strain DAOM 197198w) TaxID=1432141 RepID=A0A015KSX7_RHIIW|nr:hypothetical protein RirG_156530 [Rhizophagus irregularis DAOM 197198w]
MRLIVTVKEGVEDIVKPNLIKTKKFEIYCRVDEKSSWVYIENSDDLITEMIQGFKFTELRFKICSLADYSVAPRRNALDLIM